MSKLVLIYNKNNFYNKEAIRYAKQGYSVKLWGGDAIAHTSRLSFPSSKKFTYFSNLAQVKLNNYFSKDAFKNEIDIYRLDYIKKTIDLIFMDFVAFIETAMEIQKADNCTIVAPQYLVDIYNGTDPVKHSLLGRDTLKAVLMISSMTIRAMVCTSITRKKVNPPQILYLRKKVYPDFSMSGILERNIKAKNVTFSASYIHFGAKKSKYNIYFLNAYKGMLSRTLASFLQTMSSFFNEANYFSSLGIPGEYFVNYSRDCFMARIICKMNPRVFTGVLLDKPFFILLNKFKSSQTKLASLNESFFYAPFRSFDYNHLDTYYYMNELDLAIQNRFGGVIKRARQVDFFRKDLVTNSNGISEELKAVSSNYKHVIIVAPVQISSDSFGHWGQEDLIQFLESCINAAELIPDSLFILKEKKGEFRLMPERLIQKYLSLKNVFVIRSKSPKNNEFNQFEDIIKMSSLVISMSLTSTTIWQAFSHGVLAIAFNEIHPNSFLKEYKYLEVNSSELCDAIKYWKNMNEESRNCFIKDISERVKLGKSIGLVQIAGDLTEIATIPDDSKWHSGGIA